MKNLQDNLVNVKAKGGCRYHSDWVGGYTITLNMKWREGIKLIIHILMIMQWKRIFK